jgi:hypothetical protein
MDSLHTKDQSQLKYIFVAGAPGSKWSSVVKNIYYSPNIDQTDYSEDRTYWHDASGTLELMHLGAYFDPGMEFGDWFDRLDQHSKSTCEAEFDRPFSGTGVRIIKSHVFMHHIGFLKKNWPDCPIILVHRGDDACLGWWVKCGHFNITYPKYNDYYQDLRQMAVEIKRQNADMRSHWDLASFVYDNIELCRHLGIDLPPEPYRQNYADSKVRVKIL